MPPLLDRLHWCQSGWVPVALNSPSSQPASFPRTFAGAAFPENQLRAGTCPQIHLRDSGAIFPGQPQARQPKVGEHWQRLPGPAATAALLAPRECQGLAWGLCPTHGRLTYRCSMWTQPSPCRALGSQGRCPASHQPCRTEHLLFGGKSCNCQASHWAPSLP